MRLATHRQPGLVVTDHMFTVPVDHERAGRRHDRGVRAGAGDADAGARRAALDGVLPGRARGRVAAAAGARWQLDGAGACRLAGAAARPARHRPLDADQRPHAGGDRLGRGAGRVHGPLPGRQHRARRGADPQRAGGPGRAVGPGRAELRRLLHHDLPLDRAGGRAAGVRDRRAAAAHRGRRTRSTGRPIRGCWTRTGATSSAIPTTASGWSRSWSSWPRPRCGCPAATG